MGIFQHWPNRLTAIRFVGAIVLFSLLAIWADRPDVENIRGLLNGAFWLFVIVAATDALDGYIARRYQLVTAFGRIADPFVDKVLILGTMIFLTVLPWSREMLPAWMVVVILAREFLVTGIRGYVESVGHEFPADGFGKIKMIVQCTAVGNIIWIEAWDWAPAWLSFWKGLCVVLVWATVISTVLSGAMYVMRTKEILAGVTE